MNDYATQLRDYADSGAEDAFAPIVQRYLGLVYAAALRRVGGNAHYAEDVTQLVFIAVARNAAALARHPDLTGWLFTTTRFLSAKVLRSEQRRRQREHEAQMMHIATAAEPAEAHSTRLHAMLDELVMELRQLDRQIILMRFHRGMRLAEIGAQLDATENAVQKRLGRALEQLKEKLARRGMTSTAAALAIALEEQSAVAVPAGLATASTAAAMAGGTGAGGLLTISNLMMISKFYVGVAAAVVITASAGLMWEARANASLRLAVDRQSAALGANIAGLETQIAAESQRAAAAEADAAALRKVLPPATPVRPDGRRLTDMEEHWRTSMDRAEALRREGKLPEALDEYLSCYEFLRGKDTHPPADNQLVMSAIKRLGQTYEPATTALRNLRERAMQELQTRPRDRKVAEEIAFLNERLGEGRNTVALYDSLPPDHPARQALGLIAHASFVEAQRYSDALAGKPFGSMMNELEMRMRLASGTMDQSLANSKSFAIAGAVSNIEVLTGAGKLEEARALTGKLLSFDSSDATRAAIEQHVERARAATVK
ncbi:MAG TPA: sigma-70 family RNA polymerase sigma factor [Opitutaceae bacterium]|nr:sigma-70 family RNA polymerase sigma factor [Opitutaceae bacterium]